MFEIHNRLPFNKAAHALHGHVFIQLDRKWLRPSRPANRKAIQNWLDGQQIAYTWHSLAARTNSARTIAQRAAAHVLITA